MSSADSAPHSSFVQSWAHDATHVEARGGGVGEASADAGRGARRLLLLPLLLLLRVVAHAEVRGLQHDGDALAAQVPAEGGAEVEPQALLGLQPLGEDAREPGQLAEPEHHAAARHVADVRAPVEGQQGLLRGGRKVDVAHQHQPVAPAVHDGLVEERRAQHPVCRVAERGHVLVAFSRTPQKKSSASAAAAARTPQASGGSQSSCPASPWPPSARVWRGGAIEVSSLRARGGERCSVESHRNQCADLGRVEQPLSRGVLAQAGEQRAHGLLHPGLRRQGQQRRVVVLREPFRAAAPARRRLERHLLSGDYQRRTATPSLTSGSSSPSLGAEQAPTQQQGQASRSWGPSGAPSPAPARPGGVRTRAPQLPQPRPGPAGGAPMRRVGSRRAYCEPALSSGVVLIDRAVPPHVPLHEAPPLGAPHARIRRARARAQAHILHPRSAPPLPARSLGCERASNCRGRVSPHEAPAVRFEASSVAPDLLTPAACRGRRPPTLETEPLSNPTHNEPDERECRCPSRLASRTSTRC